MVIFSDFDVLYRSSYYYTIIDQCIMKSDYYDKIQKLKRNIIFIIIYNNICDVILLTIVFKNKH